MRFIVAAALIVGCSDGKAPTVAQNAKPEKVATPTNETLKSMAIDAVRKKAAASFGTKESEKAIITCDQTIKEYGGDKWRLTGKYDGPDDHGKRYNKRWVMFLHRNGEKPTLPELYFEDDALYQSFAPP